MWLDIAVLVIVLGSTILGYIQGFMRTFLHTVGWLLAIVLSFAWYPMVVDFLKEKTGFYDAMENSISSNIASSAEGAAADSAAGLNGLPDILAQGFQAAADAVADSVAGNLTQVLFNLLGFLVVAAAIKLIFFILMSLFSKRSNDGLTGWFDGIFGAVFGGAKGIVIVFIFLAFLVPITGLSQSPLFLDALGSSKIASALYNNNTILSVVQQYL